MSGYNLTAIKTAIQNKLINDSIYLGLLGTPTAAPYRTYYLEPDEKINPQNPWVVFWFGSSILAGDIDKPLLLERIPLDFNAWSLGNTYESIIDRIVYLMTHANDTTYGYHIILTGSANEMKDDSMNVYGKNISFMVHYRREII